MPSKTAKTTQPAPRPPACMHRAVSSDKADQRQPRDRVNGLALWHVTNYPPGRGGASSMTAAMAVAFCFFGFCCLLSFRFIMRTWCGLKSLRIWMTIDALRDPRGRKGTKMVLLKKKGGDRQLQYLLMLKMRTCSQMGDVSCAQEYKETGR